MRRELACLAGRQLAARAHIPEDLQARRLEQQRANSVDDQAAERRVLFSGEGFPSGCKQKVSCKGFVLVG